MTDVFNPTVVNDFEVLCRGIGAILIALSGFALLIKWKMGSAKLFALAVVVICIGEIGSVLFALLAPIIAIALPLITLGYLLWYLARLYLRRE